MNIPLLSSAISVVRKASLTKKLVFVAILIVVGWLARPYILKLAGVGEQTVRYQTAKAEKGTLTTYISGSGTISSGNSTTVTTGATGTVTTVYVNNGDTVTKGQKIADLELDELGQEYAAAAWLSYTNALEAVQTAKKEKADEYVQLLRDRATLDEAKEAKNYKNANTINPDTGDEYTASEKVIIDEAVEAARKAVDVSEAKYNNAGSAIANANAKVTGSLRNYQEVSSSILAPAYGVVAGLTLAKGVVISSSASTTTVSSGASTNATTVSSQTIGKVDSEDGQFQAKVSLTEIDVTSVSANQKVTLTLDAYSDKTFTGKVLAVDTSGSVSSGVTTYPVTILLDATTAAIYPNMAVTAQIITSSKSDVISVPSTAVTTTDGVSTAQVMKDGKPMSVTVDIGISSDTNTEIVSGINEGDEVVTSVITGTSGSTADDAYSPFSGTTNSSSKSSTKGAGTTVMPSTGGPPGF